MIIATVTFTAPLDADPPAEPAVGATRLPLDVGLLRLLRVGIRLAHLERSRLVATIDDEAHWSANDARVEQSLNDFFGTDYAPALAYYPGPRAASIAHDVAYGLGGEVTGEVRDEDEPEPDGELPIVY